MDIKILHNLMRSKGYPYFQGSINTISNDLFIIFSTLKNGRGNCIDVIITDDYNKIETYINGNEIFIENLTDDQVLKYIEEKL